MSRSVYVYAGLTVLALIGAYFSWTHQPSAEADEGVVIAPIDAGQVTQVTYTAGGEKVTLEPKEDGYGKYVWVSWKKPATKDKAKDAGSKSKLAGVKSAKKDDGPKLSEFKAGDLGETLIHRLAPLKAARRLDHPGKLDQFGLAKPAATLTIKLDGGDSYSLAVGSQTYGGHHYYVRDTRTGSVYLMGSGQISPLAHPDRIKEHDLYDAHRDEIVSIGLHSGDKHVTFKHHNRNDPAAAYWARGDAHKRDQTAETWLNKFFALHSQHYVTKDKLPDDLQTVFVAQINAEGKKPVRVEFLKATVQADAKKGDKGAKNSSNLKERYFARSNFTRGTVEMYRRSTSNVADDLSTLFSGDDDSGKQAAKAKPAPKKAPTNL